MRSSDERRSEIHLQRAIQSAVILGDDRDGRRAYTRIQSARRGQIFFMSARRTAYNACESTHGVGDLRRNEASAKILEIRTNCSRNYFSRQDQ